LAPRYGWVADRSAILRSDRQNEFLAMNARSPIPLRPDVGAIARSERRSFVRACTALMLGTRQGVHPRALVKSWDDAPNSSCAQRRIPPRRRTPPRWGCRLRGCSRCWRRPRPRRGSSRWRQVWT
jgi:hypothetical protein